MRILLFLTIAFIGGVFACKPSPPLPEPIVLTFWGDANPQTRQFLRTEFESFERDHPEVKVKPRFIRFKDLKATFLGTPQKPDILLYTHDWLGELVEKKLLQPVGLPPLNDVPSSMNKALSLNKNQFGLPFVYQLNAFFYNTTLVPVPPKTFENVKRIAKELNKNGHYGLMYDVGNFYDHAAFFHAWGGKLFDEKDQVAIESPPLQTSLLWRNDLIRSKVISAGSHHASMVNLFASGDLGMMVTGPWVLKDLKSKTLKYKVMAIPPLQNAQYPVSFMGVKGLGISKQSTHQKWAQKLISHLCSIPVQRKILESMDNLPVLQSVYQGQVPPLKAAFHSQQGIPMPNHAQMKTIWQEMNWLMGQTLPPKKQALEPLVHKALKQMRAAP